MKYEEFKKLVLKVVPHEEVSIRFFMNPETVTYTARIYAQEINMRIIGRPNCSKLTVRWGSGHQAMLDIGGV